MVELNQEQADNVCTRRDETQSKGKCECNGKLSRSGASTSWSAWNL